MKNNWISFLKYNKFTFGDQIVSQFVVFECKYLFSIIFFYFHKCNSSQDRYHTHAFNAISFKFFGKYTEYLYDEKTLKFSTAERTDIIKYFPRNTFHKIGNSSGCLTLLFSGPWKRGWKELVDGRIIFYDWGRKVK